MRPPDLPGGNAFPGARIFPWRFVASMRPPDLPGGNRIAALPSVAPIQALQ